MLRKILVPLDGSELAERALANATALSVATAASLVLMRAVLAHALPGADLSKAQARAMAEASDYVFAAAEQLRGRGFEVETATPYGAAADWILEETGLRHVDLIVMSTHGRSGPGRWRFGSVAEAVMARTSVPVLLVRAGLPRERQLLLGDHPRLLVPLDGSSFAEAALPVAAALADDVGASLVLTRVEAHPEHVLKDEYDRVIAYLDQLETRIAADATEYLYGVVRGLAEHWPSVSVTTQVELGDPMTGIVTSAENTGAALIVMATHARTGLSRAVLGSVAGRVLDHGSTSLVLVRPVDRELSAAGAQSDGRGADSAPVATR